MDKSVSQIKFLRNIAYRCRGKFTWKKKLYTIRSLRKCKLQLRGRLKYMTGNDYILEDTLVNREINFDDETTFRESFMTL